MGDVGAGIERSAPKVLPATVKRFAQASAVDFEMPGEVEKEGILLPAGAVGPRFSVAGVERDQAPREALEKALAPALKCAGRAADPDKYISHQITKNALHKPKFVCYNASCIGIRRNFA